MIITLEGFSDRYIKFLHTNTNTFSYSGVRLAECLGNCFMPLLFQIPRCPTKNQRGWCARARGTTLFTSTASPQKWLLSAVLGRECW